MDELGASCDDGVDGCFLERTNRVHEEVELAKMAKLGGRSEERSKVASLDAVKTETRRGECQPGES
jgi:hypothetical protein